MLHIYSFRAVLKDWVPRYSCSEIMNTLRFILVLPMVAALLSRTASEPIKNIQELRDEDGFNGEGKERPSRQIVIIPGPSKSPSPRPLALMRSTITFAADDSATVFVNGAGVGSVSDWQTFRSVTRNLKMGDVIAMRVTDTGGWLGAIAAIEYDGKAFVTGLGTGIPWRARAAWNGATNHWMLPNFQYMCHWEPVVLKDGAGTWEAGKALNGRTYRTGDVLQGFPYSKGARYVWRAPPFRNRETIYMRYRIGGEECPVSSYIAYAADNQATLYLNGQRIGHVNDWEQWRGLGQRLKGGDVIGLRVKDRGGWYGVIAAVGRWSEWSVTGRDDWRAVKAFTPTSLFEEWAAKDHNACNWPQAVVRPNSGNWEPGKARDFPYHLGAKYVWAAGAGVNDEIFLRMTVGGERC